MRCRTYAPKMQYVATLSNAWQHNRETSDLPPRGAVGRDPTADPAVFPHAVSRQCHDEDQAKNRKRSPLIVDVENSRRFEPDGKAVQVAPSSPDR